MQTPILNRFLLTVLMGLGIVTLAQAQSNKTYPDGKMVIELNAGASHILDYQVGSLDEYETFNPSPFGVRFLFGSHHKRYVGVGYSFQNINGYDTWGLPSDARHRVTFETDQYLLKTNKLGLILSLGVGNFVNNYGMGFSGSLGLSPSVRISRHMTFFVRSAYTIDVDFLQRNESSFRQMQAYSLTGGLRFHPVLQSSSSNKFRRDSIRPTRPDRIQYGVEFGLGIYRIKKPEYHPEPELEDYERAMYIRRNGYPFAGVVVAMKNQDLHSIGIGYTKFDQLVEYQFFNMPIFLEEFMLYYKYDYTPFKKTKEGDRMRWVPYIGARALWNRKQFEISYSKPFYASSHRYEFDMSGASDMALLQLSPSIKLRNSRVFFEAAMNFNLIGMMELDYEYFREDVYTRPFPESVTTVNEDRNTSEFLNPSDFWGNGYGLHDLVFKVGLLF